MPSPQSPAGESFQVAFSLTLDLNVGWEHTEKSGQPTAPSEFRERSLRDGHTRLARSCRKPWSPRANRLVLPAQRPTSLAVSVGFEYETCPSLILWEKRTAVLQGFELEPSNLGGWSLDKHHILNVKSGT